MTFFIRQSHRCLAMALCAPMLVWLFTGAIFLTKSGYEGAYERINVKTEVLQSTLRFVPNGEFYEIRYLRSCAGTHIIAREVSGWSHYDASGTQYRQPPTEAMVHCLFSEAIAVNPKRYGNVKEISGLSAVTDTGVKLQLDWQTLAITQQGNDTAWISRFYKLHYLQWTGQENFDKWFAIAVLILMITMLLLGLSLFTRGTSASKRLNDT